MQLRVGVACLRADDGAEWLMLSRGLCKRGDVDENLKQKRGFSDADTER